MPHPDRALEYAFYLKFIKWFESSGVDFWDECNAPEELARIAVEAAEKDKRKIQHHPV